MSLEDSCEEFLLFVSHVGGEKKCTSAAEGGLEIEPNGVVLNVDYFVQSLEYLFVQ